ncbi:hypothetical protein QBC39DRAFT_154540 [Podospora conica]|nr:hypothetical protein QBC39DRAFT_154540 [Schizothecium conicum]
MPCPDRESPISTRDTLGLDAWGRRGASGRRFPSNVEITGIPHCSGLHLHLHGPRDSATERRIRYQGRGSGFSSGRRCAAGGRRALSGTVRARKSQVKERTSGVETRHSPSFTTLSPWSHKAVVHQSLTRVAPFFSLFRTRGHSFYSALNCCSSIPYSVSLPLWSSISNSVLGITNGIAGVPEETGNRVAGPGLARRPLSLSRVSWPETSTLSLSLSPPSLSRDHDHGPSLAHSHSPAPTLIPLSTPRRVLIRSQRRSFFSSVAAVQSRALLSVGPRPWVGRSGRLLRRRLAGSQACRSRGAVVRG